MKILTTRAHCGHQYELWKLPHEFTVLVGFGDILDNWDFGMRPLPRTATFKNYTQVNPKEFDLAILHFDENMIRPGHPSTPDSWGNGFRWMLEATKNIPRIAICHGTPQFYEMGQINKRYLDVNVIEERRVKTVETLGDIPVVCNSNQAREEWEFKKSKTIWHGFDPSEFIKGSNHLGIISQGVGSMQQRPHYRGWFIEEKVRDILDSEIKISHTVVENPKNYTDAHDYSIKKFKNYVNTVGSYSVYLNTTWRSPMPRSRAEAMMCGLVSVNCNTHDAGMFIEHGVNGFLSNSPEEIASILSWLVNNKEETAKIGLESRKTAIEKFHINRFLSDWENTLNDLLKGNL